MPNRIVRDGILTSLPVASLGWAEEVFYRRLMSAVDDYGRFHAHPSLLRAALYPLQLTKVSDADIGKWLRASEAAGLVSVYPASDGNRYVVIIKFGQQVRAAKSKYPDPLADASNGNHLLADAHLGVSVVVSVNEDDVGPEPTATAPAFTLPLNTGKEHGITQAQVDEFASLYPATDVLAELRKMRGWLITNPTKRKTARGVGAFIARWLAKEQDKGGTSAPPGRFQPANPPAAAGNSPKKVETPESRAQAQADFERYRKEVGYT